MKIQLAFIFFLMSIQGYNSIDTYKKPIKTIIAGEVSNFENLKVQDFIQMFVEDPFSSDQISDLEYLDEDGKFRFEIKRLYPQEIFIKYKHTFQIYAFPGDSIFITIDLGILELNDNNNGDCYKHVEVHCNNQQFQNSFLNFSQEFKDSLIVSLLLLHDWCR